MLRIVSFIHFFGRIEETIYCFRDLLTFSTRFIKMIKNKGTLKSFEPIVGQKARKKKSVNPPIVLQ